MNNKFLQDLLAQVATHHDSSKNHQDEHYSDYDSMNYHSIVNAEKTNGKYLYTLEDKRNAYKYELPLCCSEKDFNSWLSHNMMCFLTKGACFCDDCDAAFQEKNMKCGTCNFRQKKLDE